MNRAEFLSLGGLLLVGKPGRALAALDGVVVASSSPAKEIVHGDWTGGWYVDDFGVVRHLYHLCAFDAEGEPVLTRVRYEGEASWPFEGELEQRMIDAEQAIFAAGGAIVPAYAPPP